MAKGVMQFREGKGCSSHLHGSEAQKLPLSFLVALAKREIWWILICL